MGKPLDQHSLHRTAKYFMDSGRAATHDAAMDLLEKFGLTIHVGEEITHSLHHQIALLTLINVARRTLLAGIEVVGLPDGISLTALAPARTLKDAVHELGGRTTSRPRQNWPLALIGKADTTPVEAPCWRVTWEGWRGGVIPIRESRHLADDEAIALAPALAAAVCAGEAFAYHAGDHPMAGRRAAENLENMPAYQALEREGMNPCGLTQLASRTVGVPFVGLIAATLVIADLLRRLHGGTGLELASGSVAALEDFETAVMPAQPYGVEQVAASHGPVAAASLRPQQRED